MRTNSLVIVYAFINRQLVVVHSMQSMLRFQIDKCVLLLFVECAFCINDASNL